MSGGGLSAIVDVVAVVVVVVGAGLFLASRFVGPKASSSGTVVVGAGLQRGLDKARRRRR
jgi:hypothetical protein